LDAVPSVDTHTFLHRQEVNYDFGTMSAPSHLAKMDHFHLEQPSIEREDPEEQLAFLLNEFGG
jgi:hypothetical protein